VNDNLEQSAQQIAEQGRDALVERLRTTYRDAAATHADILAIDDERLEELVQRAADNADGMQWRRALATVAAEQLGLGVTEALTHPAVTRAQELVGAPSYEQTLAELREAAGQMPAMPELPEVEPADAEEAGAEPEPAGEEPAGEEETGVEPGGVGGDVAGSEAELEPEADREPEAGGSPEADALGDAEGEVDVQLGWADAEASAEAEAEAEAEADAQAEVGSGLGAWAGPGSAQRPGAGVGEDTEQYTLEQVQAAEDGEATPGEEEGAAGEDAAPADGDGGGASPSGVVVDTPESLRVTAVHLGGVANLPSTDHGIDLRISGEGLDILTGEEEILGRLVWSEIDALEVPEARGRRRRRGARARLVVRTKQGDASFEIPAFSSAELSERIEPLVLRYRHT
jgi:hypothetical protein